jgi:hypothetical protein
MFLPFGIGLGIMALGVVIGVVSKLILNHFEPKAPELPDFDESKFTEIAQLKSPTLEDFKKQVADQSGQATHVIPVKKPFELEKNKFFSIQPTPVKKEVDDSDADSITSELSTVA